MFTSTKEIQVKYNYKYFAIVNFKYKDINHKMAWYILIEYKSKVLEN